MLPILTALTLFQTVVSLPGSTSKSYILKQSRHHHPSHITYSLQHSPSDQDSYSDSLPTALI